MNVRMQAAPNRRAHSAAVRDMVVLALFTAIILLMAATPIGLIDLPLIKATILHVPVIIGAIVLGPRQGAFLGAVFGLTSLVKNTMVPGVLSFAFAPHSGARYAARKRVGPFYLHGAADAHRACGLGRVYPAA